MSMSVCKRRQTNDDFWPSTGLADDILHMILEKLPLHDWSCFGKVCKSWKSIRQEAYGRKPDRWCCPWLVVQDDRKQRWTSMSKTAFWSVMKVERKLCNNKLTSLAHIPMGYLHGSHQDWMIVCHYDERLRYLFSFVNPFTDAKITLPSLSTDHTYIYGCKLLVSTSPTDPNCIYMCLPLRSYLNLCVCTRQSKVWLDTSIQRNIVDAISIVSEQRFYGLTLDDYIWYLNFSDALTAIRQLERGVKENVRYTNLRLKMPETSMKGCSIYHHKYLIESLCGDVMLVVQSLKHNRIYALPSTTLDFKIYKLDTTAAAGPREYDHEWVQLAGLGVDEILFVCREGKSKILLSAKDLGIEEGNSIYFFEMNNSSRTYRFKDNKFGSFSFPSIQDMQNPLWLAAPLRWYLYD